MQADKLSTFQLLDDLDDLLDDLDDNFSEELDFATQSFSQLVGKGSFGCIYKGVMQHISVAVKVMDPVSRVNHKSYSIHVHIYVPFHQKALHDINHATFVTEVQALTRYLYASICFSII